jgi:hypothetical protein
VKVTTDLRPDAEVEFELVRDVSMAWVRLPDLTQVAEEDLRRAHLHALHEAFLAAGLERDAIDRRALRPIEAELRSRGLEIDYSSMDDARRTPPPLASQRFGDEPLGDMAITRSSLPDLASVGEKRLRQLHLRVIREMYAATTGPRRMGLGGWLLTPIEAEMKRRGLTADFWSMEHKRRSDDAYQAEQN